MKSLVFGRRRTAKATPDVPGSLDAALAPAYSDGQWRVPEKFNFTRDVVEVLARNRNRQAFTFVWRDGIIEPRTFFQVSHGAARWATLLRELGVAPGDRVLVVVGETPEWIEAVLACIKIGAVAVPCSESLPAQALEIRVAAVGARVVISAGSGSVPELRPPTGEVAILGVDDVRREARRLPREAPTADTSADDAALVVWTTGRTNGPRGATHTHAAIFAARHAAEHWLDAGPGDVVWCSAPPGSAAALWSSVFGPWSRGAEVVLSEPPLDPGEEIDLVRRLEVTTLWRTPGEYAVLTESDRLEHLGTRRLRRLVSTGSPLPEVLIEIMAERTGLVIQDGYAQAETGVIVAHDGAGGSRLGSVGRPLPGYEVVVVDASGHELPPGQLGDLAVRGTPPSLFAGYWGAPSSTKSAFRGGSYLTGDVGACDDAGFLWLAGRAGDGEARAATVLTPPVETPESEYIARPPEPEAARQANEVRVADEPQAAPTTERVPSRERLYTPLWARVIGAIWLLLLGVLIGGAAIPHASDEPRVVPRSTPPNAICLAPSQRR